ncbi:MAG: PHP domain-containing protein [Oscillochloridaceae bacterium umkhey_bin13]
MSVDLHIHTTATPHHASWTPAALAAAAAQRGLTAIAAADHNTTASVAALREAARPYGLHVISGVELDSGFNGKLWHTLVYGADPAAPALVALCDEVFARNAEDAQRLIKTLPNEGFWLPDFAPLGRQPNVAEVATALAQHNPLPGRVDGEGNEEAGMRFLLTQRPGSYRPLGVDEVIAVAHQLNALAVLAHPGRSKGIYAIPADEADLAAMVAVGLDGIEVAYPSHTSAQVAFYADQAERYGLLVSGGSDSHHPRQPLAAVPRAMVTLLDQLR